MIHGWQQRAACTTVSATTGAALAPALDTEAIRRESLPMKVAIKSKWMWFCWSRRWRMCVSVAWFAREKVGQCDETAGEHKSALQPANNRFIPAWWQFHSGTPCSCGVIDVMDDDTCVHTWLPCSFFFCLVFFWYMASGEKWMCLLFH